ncbi:hypothetical protein E4U15_003014 [Claviceps sp. LM218 group G6]|nr:hypothetical protein E4U15_003014 [Claviceps sp. LM218 group G6]
MLRSPPRIRHKVRSHSADAYSINAPLDITSTALFRAAYVRAAAELTIKRARVPAVGRASSLYAATVVSSQALDAIYAGELESGQFAGGGKAKKDKAELELHAIGAWGFRVSGSVSLSR